MQGHARPPATQRFTRFALSSAGPLTDPQNLPAGLWLRPNSSLALVVPGVPHSPEPHPRGSSAARGPAAPPAAPSLPRPCRAQPRPGATPTNATPTSPAS